MRERIATLARSYVGCTAADPRYVDLVGLGETERMRADMLTMSGCALVVAGLWRLAGLTASELAPPYRIGSAISRLQAVARRCGAWRQYRLGALPCVGDVVLVQAPEHVYTVVTQPIATAAQVTFTSVDGGQIEHGRQAIKLRARTWAHGFDRARDDQAGALGRARTIVGWVDVGTLPFMSPEQQVYE